MPDLNISTSKLNRALNRKKSDKPLIGNLRISEICRLLRDRRASGPLEDQAEEIILEAVLPYLASLPSPARGPSRAISWAELHVPAVLARRGAAWIDELAHQRRRCLKPRALGCLLRLTAEERSRLRITTIQPVDRTRAELAADRRTRDADRKRAKRLAAGATPRSQSLSALVPWEAEGITRRTWERRRARQDPAVSQIRRQQETFGLTLLVADEFATPVTDPPSGEAGEAFPAPPAAPVRGLISSAALAALAMRRSRAPLELIT